MPEVAGEGVAPELSNGRRHLHSRRAAPYHHKRQVGVPPGNVGLPLRLLEGEQHALPDIEGVLEGLQARGQWRPCLVLSVVGGLHAGGSIQ